MQFFNRRLKPIIILWLLCVYGISMGQTPLGNPYDAIYNHLYNLQPENYNPQVSARSFPSSLDSTERQKLSQELKQIYDGQGLYVHVERIPKDPNYLDSISQSQQYFPFPEDLPDVYVEKMGDEWKYSLHTAKSIPGQLKSTYPFGIYHLIGLTAGRKGSKLFGIYYWQYLGILILFGLVVLVYLLLKYVLDAIITKLVWKPSLIDEIKKGLIRKVDKYLILSILAFILIHFLPILRLPIKFATLVQDIGRIFMTVFLMLLFINVINVIKEYLKDVTARTESRLDEQLLPILTKFAKIVITVIAVFRVLHILDVNVTALIAGISIGGLALALAAQDTVKNFFGSMMIFFDKPFQIGDYVVTGDGEGSVTEVGFRSTRIRRADTSIITVPNAKIADASLTNMGVRNMRMMNMNLTIMYNTPVDNIQSFISGLKEIVGNHDKIFKDTQYIYLKDLSSSSIDILFRIYLETRDFEEELALKEEIIFSILRLAEKVEVSFAFPSTSIYIEDMPK